MCNSFGNSQITYRYTQDIPRSIRISGPQNKGMVPSKAIFSGHIPFHSSYIGLCKYINYIYMIGTPDLGAASTLEGIIFPNSWPARDVGWWSPVFVGWKPPFLLDKYVYDCLCLWFLLDKYMFMIVYVYDSCWINMFMIVYVYDSCWINICLWLFMFMILVG